MGCGCRRSHCKSRCSCVKCCTRKYYKKSCHFKPVYKTECRGGFGGGCGFGGYGGGYGHFDNMGYGGGYMHGSSSFGGHGGKY